jgi:hypothetical protein
MNLSSFFNNEEFHIKKPEITLTHIQNDNKIKIETKPNCLLEIVEKSFDEGIDLKNFEIPKPEEIDIKVPASLRMMNNRDSEYQYEPLITEFGFNLQRPTLEKGNSEMILKQQKTQKISEEKNAKLNKNIPNELIIFSYLTIRTIANEFMKQ